MVNRNCPTWAALRGGIPPPVPIGWNLRWLALAPRSVRGRQAAQRVDGLALNATSDDKKRQQRQELMHRQGELLHKPSDSLKAKSNFYKDIHRKVASMETNWRRIEHLGGLAGI